MAIRQSVGRVTARGDVRVGTLVFGLAAFVPLIGKLAGVLNPPLELQVVVLVAATFATAAGGRARTLLGEYARAQEHDRICSTALAAWPLPTLESIEESLLGVFPWRGRNRGADRYVPRTVDANLVAAIAAEPFVLVFGAPAAGKTRTAYEAARAALPDALVVVPEGPAELGQLVDLDPPLDPGGEKAILWLDELDRFVGPPLARFVDRLAADKRWRVVATVREEEWRRLLESGSNAGSIARRLVTRAHRFRLAGRVGVGDARLIGLPLVGRRFGLRRAWAWRQDGAPVARADAPAARPPARRLPTMTRDLRLVGSLAVLLAALGVGGWFVAHGGVSARPVSFTDRFDKMRHDDARGRAIEGDLNLHMRAGGQLTYVTVFHDRTGRRSDELALYEQVGDRPRVAMRFEPLADHGAPWLFTRQGGGAVDLNGNSRHELVGFFARPGVPDGRVPVIVFWDASTLRYRTAALIRRPTPRRGWHLDLAQRRRYGRRQSLVPVGRGAVVHGYAVGAAQVVSGGGRTRLVAALYARPPRAGVGSARLATWELGSTDGEPDRARRCAVPPHLVRLEVLGFDVAARTQLQRTARRLPGTCE